MRAGDAAALGLSTSAQQGYVTVGFAYFHAWSSEPVPEHEPVAVEPLPEADALASRPSSIVVVTDGDPASVERARTAALTDVATTAADPVPLTVGEQLAGSSLPGSAAEQYAGLASVAVVIATLISAVALAVSTTAGVVDRRRALSLLRLTGMPARRLRRMIALEAAVPVAATFLLCIGLGVFVAWALIAGLSAERTIGWPGLDYYLTVAACLVLAALAVTATFPTARRATAVTETRFE